MAPEIENELFGKRLSARYIRNLKLTYDSTIGGNSEMRSINASSAPAPSPMPVPTEEPVETPPDRRHQPRPSHVPAPGTEEHPDTDFPPIICPIPGAVQLCLPKRW